MRCFSNQKDEKKFISQIKQHTVVSRHHLVPEIQLYLITPECPHWHLPEKYCAFKDPFWAFFWPGGQAVTRWVMDNPDFIKNKRVLDIGSGCGATAIACYMQGARCVLANDIDSAAAEALKLNFSLNYPDAAINSSDVLRSGFNVSTTDFLCDSMKNDSSNSSILSQCTWDFIILGDMFYDEHMTKALKGFLHRAKSPATRIILGDPNRGFLNSFNNLRILHKYELPKQCILENYGHTTALVMEVCETETV
ncbi:electron transfer flavoprotein beta subunit lysine methyltransferase-like isoform X2 [Clavelina lepadiformis]